MGRQKPDDIEDKIKELRSVTREANESIQALRSARQDFVKVIEAAQEMIDLGARDIVSKAVADSIEGLNASTSRAIERAEESVNERFDVMTGILLGEDVKGKRRGESIPDMILRMPTRDCCGGRHMSRTCPYGGVPGSRNGN